MKGNNRKGSRYEKSSHKVFLNRALIEYFFSEKPQNSDSQDRASIAVAWRKSSSQKYLSKWHGYKWPIMRAPTQPEHMRHPSSPFAAASSLVSSAAIVTTFISFSIRLVDLSCIHHIFTLSKPNSDCGISCFPSFYRKCKPIQYVVKSTTHKLLKTSQQPTSS